MRRIILYCLAVLMLFSCLSMTGCGGGLVHELLEVIDDKEYRDVDDHEHWAEESLEQVSDDTMYGEVLPEAIGLSFALTKDRDSYEVVGIGSCEQTEFSIPYKHEGLPVTKIAMEAFAYCDTLVKVAIPNSVYLIDTTAFQYCKNLESVYIPSSVTVIGDAVFEGCSKIKSFDIPVSVQRIGIGAFSAGESLERITVAAGNAYYYVENNCLIERKTGRLISGGSNSKIPEGVRIIGYIAFKNCVDMQEIMIPEGVEAIHEMAFDGCTSLAYASLPSSLQTMQGFAFSDCTSLKQVEIAEGVGEIGLCAFYGTAITELRIPESVTNLGSQCAEGCKRLKTVYLPAGLTKIEFSAFQDCTSLRKIYFSGTTDQWSLVTKEDSWDMNTPRYTVYCSDGDTEK